MKRTEIAYQTKTVTKAIGAPIGSTTNDFQLNTDYDRCNGIAFIEVTDGGLPGGFYEVAVLDEKETYHSKAHKSIWKAGDNVAPDEKFKSLTFDISDGIKTKILTHLPASPVGVELKYQMIFRLERDVIER